MSALPVASQTPANAILHGDCLEVLRSLPDACVDAIVTDPPYFRVKGEAWDRQWKDARAFLAWLATMADEWRRVLKPNGSLYCFASSQMAARVEVMLGERMNVLNRIRWVKGAGWHKKAEKEALRSYLSPWEEIIFAEQYGADSMALGESGYAAQCEKLHGFVFEPLRAYLEGERIRAGITRDECNVACGTRSMAARHFFTRSQWCLPTEAHYKALQRLFNRGAQPAEYLRQDYEELRQDYEELRQDYEELRQDYEELRRQYEDLRRPFSVTADVQYTDVWDFAPVAYRPGKHPCEKPLPLLRHIIRSSTRPDALILDCFAGSGATLEAAKLEGRRYLGVEREARYVAQARKRLDTAAPHLVLLPPSPQPEQPARIMARSLWEVSA